MLGSFGGGECASGLSEGGGVLGGEESGSCLTGECKTALTTLRVAWC